MKKYALLSALFFAMCYSTYAQVSFESKAQTSDKPLYEMEFSPRLKLNGYVNLGGNDSKTSQSLNLNSANPYNPFKDKNADANMYQTQLAWKTTYNGFEKGPLVTYVEGQWWGGPGAGGNLQLRVAYVDYNHWHVGQDWSFFGGGVPTWCNTLDWEGPNSGTWARHLQAKYYTNFGKDKLWKFEGGIETTAQYLKVAGGSMPGQFSVDPIFAFTKYAQDGSFARLAFMGRSIRYTKEDASNTLAMGWGINANLKSKLNDKSYFLAQGLVGSGIAGSYTLSGALFGNGGATNMYDGIYDQNGNFKTVPVYGGSAGIEYFFGPKKNLHSNLVLGYTNMSYNASPLSLVQSKVINDNATGDFVTKNNEATTHTALTFGSINMLYDVTKITTMGIEYDAGTKQITNSISQSSMVNRVALGLKVGF
ncbi:hypothetical protein [Flavobacterium sp. 245]|uniref:hypothetical protein n=1 Tax=Flavobacterium sp. 245 TaxID=2512115 RepID=UPI00105DDEEC|nr:hypothetical protein [Flavobacterium sp. 245]TDO94931.1 hypothetical protein EV145_11516 [Flavobacterium sp. 245]